VYDEIPTSRVATCPPEERERRFRVCKEAPDFHPAPLERGMDASACITRNQAFALAAAEAWCEDRLHWTF